MSYVVSKSGTFGVVQREYTTDSGVAMVVIRWGPLSWITPVAASECLRLRSENESEARQEAEEWLLSEQLSLPEPRP
jgi:hypothetical protein